MHDDSVMCDRCPDDPEHCGYTAEECEEERRRDLLAESEKVLAQKDGTIRGE